MNEISTVAATPQNERVAALINTKDSVDALKSMGEFIANSKLAGARNTDEGVVVALTCAKENITPIEFGRKYHLYDTGKRINVTMQGQAMLAEFYSRGGHVEWMERSDKACRARFTIHGRELVEEFTIEEARRAGLDKKDVWQNYPKNMLQWRVVANALRAVYPEAFYGIYLKEELERQDPDYPQRPPLFSDPDHAREVDARVVEDTQDRPDDESASRHSEAWKRLVEHRDIVEPYLRVKAKMLRDGQSLENLSAGNRDRIINGIDKVIKVAGEFAKEGDGA